MKKRPTGSWQKERAVGRKYSKSDSHTAPQAHTRSKYWVGSYTRRGRRVKGGYRRNPAKE